MKKISILALDNAISSSVMGSMDIFCQAGLTWNYFFGKDPASYFEVEIVTQDGKPVTCLNKVKIYPHRAAAEVKSTVCLIANHRLRSLLGHKAGRQKSHHISRY